MSGLLNVAILAAHKAGVVIMRGAHKLSKINARRKGNEFNNFVTDIDLAAEEVIFNIVHTHYPDHNILAEESGLHDYRSEYTWVIDPLDGTNNFIRGYPYYCVSIAVIKDDATIVAVILDPVRNNLYVAELGCGAAINNKKIRTSQLRQLQQAMLAISHHPRTDHGIEYFTSVNKQILRRIAGYRSSGSAALDLAFVASGVLDGCFGVNLKSWDVTAGNLLIKEAGGIVIEQLYHDYQLNIASNVYLVDDLLSILTQDNEKG